jgi:hypothetical protein
MPRSPRSPNSSRASSTRKGRRVPFDRRHMIKTDSAVKHLFGVMPDLIGRSSTPRLIRSITDVSGILDAPDKPRHDSGMDVSPHSRGIMTRVLLYSSPSREHRGRRECRMPNAPGSLACKNGRKNARKSSQVRRTIRHSLRDGSRLIRALLGVPGFLATVTPRGSPAKLNPSVGGSGPRDFARPRQCRFVSQRLRVHRNPPHVS